MSTMVRLTLRVKCMELATCSSRTGLCTKECFRKEAERDLASHLTLEAISTKVSIGKLREKVREYLRLLMARYMKEVGAITRCMAEEERPSKMGSAL